MKLFSKRFMGASAENLIRPGNEWSIDGELERRFGFTGLTVLRRLQRQYNWDRQFRGAHEMRGLLRSTLRETFTMNRKRRELIRFLLTFTTLVAGMIALGIFCSWIVDRADQKSCVHDAQAVERSCIQEISGETYEFDQRMRECQAKGKRAWDLCGGE